MPPLISCVIPTYNYAQYIGEALDSILAQTYRPTEVIVVDGGSTDNTREVVAGYGSQVRYVHQLCPGPAQMRNLGIGLAQGEFVAFLDADDLWHPEKLAQQMARFDARPALGYCLTFIKIFWAEALRAEAERLRDHPRTQPVPGYATVTLLARRDLFVTVGLLNEALDFADAVDWFLRAAELGVAMEVLPDVLVYRRVHGANLTRRDVQGKRHEWLSFIKTHLDKQRAAGLPGLFLSDMVPDD